MEITIIYQYLKRKVYVADQNFKLFLFGLPPLSTKNVLQYEYIIRRHSSTKEGPLEICVSSLVVLRMNLN